MAAGIRRLENWIEAFVEYTEVLPSPPLLRKWAAIATIAAALERRVWVRAMGADLYPNLYTILVGPPGVGKSVALREAERLIRGVPDLHIGPSDMTSASLIDALNEAQRRMVRPGLPLPIEYNSLIVYSRELGVLIPAWESALLSNLTDIYDGEMVDQKRRGKDLRIKILHPQINLVGATTPSYLNSVMPEGAWDQGFISRTILVYSGERTLRDPFSENANLERLARLHADLQADIKMIGLEFGQVKFSSEAITAIRAWENAGRPPEPNHGKLVHYNTRRLAHLLKLCVVSSMARGPSYLITVDNYAEALNWLCEAEANMPDIFKSMAQGGDSAAMEDAWHFVWTAYSREKVPIAEHRIVHFLKERIPAHSVMRVLEIMVKSKMFEIVLDKNGFAGYKPAAKIVRLETAHKN